MARNLTIRLDEEVLAQARVAAAERGESVSSLVRLLILRLAEDKTAFDSAREAARRRLSRGARLGGRKLPSRDVLHERRR